MRLSIIIPARNESACIGECLQALQEIRSGGHEVILVDGGSTDDTREIAAGCVDLLIDSPPGRAVQMNRGAARASGDVFLFLHADARLPGDAAGRISAALPEGAGWGRFDVRLTGRSPAFRIIEYFMNLRSRLTGIATGDQGIFVDRRLFGRCGGFAEIPLMEDVEFSRHLRRVLKPACLRARMLVSSRRWEQRGVLRTVLQMWALRLRYALGTDPAILAREYE